MSHASIHLSGATGRKSTPLEIEASLLDSERPQECLFAACFHLITIAPTSTVRSMAKVRHL
jgi:hypothetical protein